MGIQPLLPFDTTRAPVFLIQYNEVQTLLPPHAEKGEVPSSDAKTGNGKVNFQAAQFISFQNSILFPPLPPHHSPPSFPLVIPLSNFTQVGGESGTSRRRSVMLYIGANYPLLYWRMGKDNKEWGKKKGRGACGKTCGRWSIFLKNRSEFCVC